MAAIDVGNAAVNRNSYINQGNTNVDSTHSANASGTITSVEIYATTAMNGVSVGIFSAVGNALTTRAYVSIGNIAQYKTTHSVNLEIEEGDYIGIYWTSGTMENETSVINTGRWYYPGNVINSTGRTFSISANKIMSIQGFGSTSAGVGGVTLMMGANF